MSLDLSIRLLLRTHRRKLAIWLAVSAVFMIWHKRFKQRSRLPQSHDKRPFVAFGGSGALYMAYMGVVVYLERHFRLDNVRFSGISSGTFALLTHLCRKTSIEETLQRHCELFAQTESKSSVTQATGLLHCADTWKSGAIAALPSTRSLTSLCSEVYAGITTRRGSKCVRVEMSDKQQSVDAMLASAHLSPFWSTSAWKFDGSWAVDGGLFSSFCLPKDQDPTKVLRVATGLLWERGVDITITGYGPIWNMLRWKIGRWPDDVKHGYDIAKQNHCQFLRIGMTEKSIPDAEPDWRHLQQIVRAFKSRIKNF